MSNDSSQIQSQKKQFLGVGDKIGTGDSYLRTNVLSEGLERGIFAAVRDEVEWHTMMHRGGEVPRLVAVQGELQSDGSEPIYRHPSDQSPPLRPFCPVILQIRDEVQRAIEQPLNHVLIQHYRSGSDYISEHSDKTIDIVRGSSIVNVSIGAQRTMTLHTKKDQLVPGARRLSQRIRLPHNSLFILGPETNKKWLHGINHDNRPFGLKSRQEQRENCERISLTFRHIGTFLTKDHDMIYGQGSTGKTFEDKKSVINYSKDDTQSLLNAFGQENHQSNFDWDKAYGAGFDIVHFRAVST